MALIFDIETDGFLDETTRVHVLVIKNTETKAVWRFNDRESSKRVLSGVQVLSDATHNGTYIVAHNGIKFDIPVLKKLYQQFRPNELMVLDTLVMSRLLFPDLYDHDAKLVKAGKLPSYLIKKHSLEAWGYRLGEHKIDYTAWCQEQGIADPWAKWTPEMEDYCVQDVLTLEKLWEFFEKQKYPAYPIQLEHEVAWIVARQERHGFLFDMKKAGALHAKLVEHKLSMEAKLNKVFHPRYLRAGKVKVPAKDTKVACEGLGLDYSRPRYEGKGEKKRVTGYYFKTLGYAADAGFTPVKLTPFNPGSRDHVALWLNRLYKWTPKEFTNDGKPKVDETVLSQLPWAEAKVLAEYYMVTKRLGQLAEGDQAWFRHVKPDGRIHGGVITNGAVTGRMTHATPNMGQVPASRSPYGHECRECFIVPVGKVLVGADAAALELRCLAGYMARWDGGAYILTVVDGKKEDGTEVHSVTRRALEIDSRDDAKTWFYAFIYGAGDEKLGFILIKVKGAKAKKRGKASRDLFLTNIPALGKLVKAVQDKVKKQGMLRGLDGRWLHVRSQHSALNTLLQGAGAIIMKVALVILDKQLQSLGYVPGVNYEFVANVHDEWQIECDADIAERVGVCAIEAMEAAGKQLGFRCPITGEYGIGKSWAETH